MQELLYTALVPHPPLLIPTVGHEETIRVRATAAAMEQVAAEVVRMQPDTVIIISPHGPVFQDAIAVHRMDRITGHFGLFGAPETAFDVPIDSELAAVVARSGGEAGFAVAEVTADRAADWDAEQLDHGTMVPLYFLQQAGWRGPILPMAMGLLPPEKLYAFGKALQVAVDLADRRVVILASGDLSHRLTPEAPAGFHPAGTDFDRAVVEAMGRGDLGAIFRTEPGLCQSAGECGLRPLMMLAGALDGLEIRSQVHSYEGPFGVGYAVVSLRPGGADPSRELLPQMQEARRQEQERRRQHEHPVVLLARLGLEHYVMTGLELDYSAGGPHEGTVPWQLPDGLPERAGLFVSLKIAGELRGCMGTTEPTESTLWLQIVRNAIMAGTEDPRFSPVEEEELPELAYTVDILGKPERCTPDGLDPDRFGLIVALGEERGLLLPDLPGVETVGEQIDIACRKAGLRPDDPALELYRFQVKRYQ